MIDNPPNGDLSNKVLFSFDGSNVLSGGISSGNLLKRDAANGRPLQSLKLSGYEDLVNAMTLSPNGAQMLSGSHQNSDYSLRLWDVADGTLLKTLRGHRNYIQSATYSADGTRIASGSSDNTVRLWDVVSGKSRITYKGHTFGVTSVAFSSDCIRVSSGSIDGTIRIWDIAGGTLLASLQGDYSGTNQVYSTAFSPIGNRNISGSAESTIRVWIVSNCVSTLIKEISHHPIFPVKVLSI